MSVLLATAMLLIGAGGYISCSLKEEKEKQRQPRAGKSAGHKAVCTDEPAILGQSGNFVMKKTEHEGRAMEISLLSGETRYSYAVKNQYERQPELLGRGAFEARRKTA